MFKWEDKYNINVTSIDEEHKLFISILNKYYTLNQINDKSEIKSEILSEVLNEMTLYALSHFKNEEEFMKKIGYPEYQVHKNEHKDFLLTTVSFCTSVAKRNNNIIDDLFVYLKQWMTEHILVSDKKYSEYFKKNGVI